MISAPERTTEIKSAELATQETVFAEPHIRTHGHLALVNWAEPSGRTTDRLTNRPTNVTVAVKPQFLKDPVCKSAADRWFERAIFLLMASSVAAISACFLH